MDGNSKKKKAVTASSLIAGGSYLNKLGNIAKGPYVGGHSTGFSKPNRPLYFKPGKGVVKGSQAFNNAVWRAEAAADSAVRNRININADISPGYDWKKTAKVKNIRTAGKVMRTIGKTSNIIGLGLIAAEGIYKGAKRALGPEGTKFHTGTGVPVWEDRNSTNNKTKLNP